MHTFSGGPDGDGPALPADRRTRTEICTARPTRAASATRVSSSGSFPPRQPPPWPSVFPTSGRAAGGASVRVGGTHFQSSAGASFGGLASLAVLGADSRTVIALAPALAPGSVSDMTVTNLDATTATLSRAWFADFLDVDSLNLFHDDVEAIVRAGITAGCGSGNYCVVGVRHARADGRLPSQGKARRRPRSAPGDRNRLPRRPRGLLRRRLDRGARVARRHLRLRRRQLLPGRLRHAGADGRLPAQDLARLRLRPAGRGADLRRRRARRLCRRLDQRPLRPRHHRRLQRGPAALLSRQREHARTDGRFPDEDLPPCP